MRDRGPCLSRPPLPPPGAVLTHCGSPGGLRTSGVACACAAQPPASPARRGNYTVYTSSGPRGGAGGANRSDCVFAGLQRLACAPLVRAPLREAMPATLRQQAVSSSRHARREQMPLAARRAEAGMSVGSVCHRPHTLPCACACDHFCGRRRAARCDRLEDRLADPTTGFSVVWGRVGDTGFSSAARRTRADARSVLGARQWQRTCVTVLWEKNGGG